LATAPGARPPAQTHAGGKITQHRDIGPLRGDRQDKTNVVMLKPVILTGIGSAIEDAAAGALHRRGVP
jgi:hypothetical protein